MPGKFEMEPEPGDLTPVVGAATDVSPLGRDLPKPAHELTADEDKDVADWDRVAAMTEFRKLLARKRKFIIPATVFFIAYYFALGALRARRHEVGCDGSRHHRQAARTAR